MQFYSKSGRQLIGSLNAASNISGVLTDTVSFSALLHKYRALSLWDFASAAPYVKMDMNPLVLGSAPPPSLSFLFAVKLVNEGQVSFIQSYPLLNQVSFKDSEGPFQRFLCKTLTLFTFPSSLYSLWLSLSLHHAAMTEIWSTKTPSFSRSTSLSEDQRPQEFWWQRNTSFATPLPASVAEEPYFSLVPNPLSIPLHFEGLNSSIEKC